MKRSEVLRYRKIGMETLLTSIKFFLQSYIPTMRFSHPFGDSRNSNVESLCTILVRGDCIHHKMFSLRIDYYHDDQE